MASKLADGFKRLQSSCALQVDIYTASGAPAVSTPVLRSLAGKPGAAKKALLELEGLDVSANPADDFEGEQSDQNV